MNIQIPIRFKIKPIRRPNLLILISIILIPDLEKIITSICIDKIDTILKIITFHHVRTNKAQIIEAIGIQNVTKEKIPPIEDFLLLL